MSEPAEPFPPGAVEANGHVYMVDAKGALIPIESVKPADLLQDELVRKLFAAAAEVSAIINRFKAGAFADVDAFNDLLADKYKARVGGVKGNMTLATFDGLQRVQVQISDQFRFGPELQQAKALVDECLAEWSADSGPELRTIVTQAFQVDKEGQINRGRLFALLRYEITDPRWLRAMDAIRDSQVVEGSKRYVRFYSKPSRLAGWQPLSLDAATA